MRSWVFSWALAGLLLLGPGCAYRLQNSGSDWLEQEGVRRIYVSPMVNNTFKSGAENVVYNALLREILGSRRIQLVREPETADALLQGTVVRAEYSRSGSTQIGGGGIYSDFSITTEYVASLECSFTLTRRQPRPGQRAILWGASFARAKPFAASNQLGSIGNTSALINESEFDRTLADISKSMMVDVRESVLSRF